MQAWPHVNYDNTLSGCETGILASNFNSIGQRFHLSSKQFCIGILSAQLLQASGEADYVSTMAEQQGQLYIQFVLSTVGNATIGDMDASEAMVRP